MSVCHYITWLYSRQPVHHYYSYFEDCSAPELYEHGPVLQRNKRTVFTTKTDRLMLFRGIKAASCEHSLNYVEQHAVFECYSS
jgi:hypothetical protein